MTDATLAPLIAPVLRPTVSATGLPNALYTEDEMFRLERDRVFRAGWSCVGVASEVPTPGDCLPVSFLGMPLLMVRGRDGEVRVFHNVCSHRGVVLVETPTNAPVIRCPYHSWAYDLEGRLVRTPDIGGSGVNAVEGMDNASMGLRPVLTARWLDFIFVNLDGGAAPLDAWLAPLQRRWAHYRLDLIRWASSIDFEIRANWKLLTENTIEFYHLPWIHRGLESYSPSEAHYFCNAEERFVGTATRDYRPQGGPGAALPRFPGLSAEQELVGEYPVVFPNLWLGVQVDHFFAVVLYPDGPAATRERQHLYFVGDAAMDEAHAATRRDIVERWREINAEDIAISESLQRGRASPGFDGGRLSPAQDFGNHHFQRLVAAALAGAHPAAG